MPVLRHHVPGQRFDIMQSDVCAWLIDQPAIRQEIFNWVKRNGGILFDVETGRWRGANYSG